MAFRRLPAPLAELSSPVRAGLAAVGIAVGLGLIVLGGKALEGDATDLPDPMVTTTVGS